MASSLCLSQRGSGLPPSVSAGLPKTCGHEVVAAAHRDIHALRVVHGVDRDIAARVARADDEHALALELLGALVLAGVQQLTRKLPLEARHIGFGQRAVGNHHALVDGALQLARRIADAHAPGRERVAGLHGLHAFHTHAEAEMAAQIEAVGKGREIAAQLAVARVVGHLVGHGEFGELGRALARYQVRRLVDRGARIGDVPEPAHIGIGLEALEGNAQLLQVARPGQADGPAPISAIICSVGTPCPAAAWARAAAAVGAGAVWLSFRIVSVSIMVQVLRRACACGKRNFLNPHSMRTRKNLGKFS